MGSLLKVLEPTTLPLVTMFLATSLIIPKLIAKLAATPSSIRIAVIISTPLFFLLLLLLLVLLMLLRKASSSSAAACVDTSTSVPPGISERVVVVVVVAPVIPPEPLSWVAIPLIPAAAAAKPVELLTGTIFLRSELLWG